jgi:hypothetical protein
MDKLTLSQAAAFADATKLRALAGAAVKGERTAIQLEYRVG